MDLRAFLRHRVFFGGHVCRIFRQLRLELRTVVGACRSWERCLWIAARVAGPRTAHQRDHAPAAHQVDAAAVRDALRKPEHENLFLHCDVPVSAAVLGVGLQGSDEHLLHPAGDRRDGMYDHHCGDVRAGADTGRLCGHTESRFYSGNHYDGRRGCTDCDGSDIAAGGRSVLWRFAHGGIYAAKQHGSPAVRGGACIGFHNPDDQLRDMGPAADGT